VRAAAVHADQLVLEPERGVSLERALEELDVAAAERNLAADHAERMAAPRARPCRCGRRAWGYSRVRHCCRCGRDQQLGTAVPDYPEPAEQISTAVDKSPELAEEQLSPAGEKSLQGPPERTF
jgi:hypothetical protein